MYRLFLLALILASPASAIQSPTDVVSIGPPSVSVPVTVAAAVDGGGLVPRLTLMLTPFRGDQSVAQMLPTPVDFRQLVLEGEYRVSWSALPAGYYLKSITSGSTDVLANPLKVTAKGAPPHIVVTLGVASPPPWVKVSGRVTGLSNNPITEPLLVVLTEATTMTTTVPVNPDGSFEFPMVLPGTYTARLIPMPMRPISVTVPSRDLADLQLAVPPLKPVTMRLTINGNGTPPSGQYGTSGLTLLISDVVSGTTSIPVAAQPDGTFSVLMPEGAYRITLLALGYTVQGLKYGSDDLMRLPMTVSAADRTELLATLMPSPGVRGGVVGGVRGGVLGGVLGGTLGGTLGGVQGGTLGGVVGGPPLSPPTRVAPPPPPPPPPPPRDPIRVGGDVLQANCLSCLPPAYPLSARTARVSDTVVLSAVVGKDGTVLDVRVIRGHQLLRDAAVDAVRQWRYKPQMLNGQPVEVTASISISFVFN